MIIEDVLAFQNTVDKQRIQFYSEHSCEVRSDVQGLIAKGEIASTIRRPLRSILRMRWFFEVSKVKESSFF